MWGFCFLSLVGFDFFFAIDYNVNQYSTKKKTSPLTSSSIEIVSDIIYYAYFIHIDSIEFLRRTLYKQI